MYKLLETSRKNSLLCCYFGYNFRIQRFDPGNQNCRRNRGGNMGQRIQNLSLRKFCHYISKEAHLFQALATIRYYTTPKIFCTQNVKMRCVVVLYIVGFKRDSKITLRIMMMLTQYKCSNPVVSVVCISFSFFVMSYYFIQNAHGLFSTCEEHYIEVI